MEKKTQGKGMNTLSKKVTRLEEKVDNVHKRIDELHFLMSTILSLVANNNAQAPHIVPPQVVEGFNPMHPPMEQYAPPMPIVQHNEEVVVDENQTEEEVNEEVADGESEEDYHKENPDLAIEVSDEEVLDVVMPLAEGRYIAHEVLAGLVSQCKRVRLWTSTQVNDGNFARARNQVKQYAMSTPYTLMIDNDLVLPPNGLARMIDFLDRHSEFGAIGISKTHLPDPAQGEVEINVHVDPSPVLWRTELFHEIPYMNRGSCECMAYCEDIRARGLEVGVLTGMTAKHIIDTRWESIPRTEHMLESIPMRSV